MVKLDKIYTRGGDGGESSLVDGTRLAKDSPTFEAIGAVDEANSALGVARGVASKKITPLLATIQNNLFDLGADIATPYDGGKADGALRIRADQVLNLENEIDAITKNLRNLTSFVLPGGSAAAGALHMARAIVRRAERRVVSLQKEKQINPEALKYLNRLSDLLFQLSRLENDGGKADILWKPGGE